MLFILRKIQHIKRLLIYKISYHLVQPFAKQEIMFKYSKFVLIIYLFEYNQFQTILLVSLFYQ